MMSHITQGRVAEPQSVPISEDDSPLVHLAYEILRKTKEAIPHINNLPDQPYSISRQIFLELVRRRAGTQRGRALVKDLHVSGVDLKKTGSDLLSLPTFEKEKSYDHLLQEVRSFPKNILKMRNTGEWAEFNAVKGLKFGVGQCSELSAFAFYLFLEYPVTENKIKIEKPISIERVQLDKEDHTWLILNRDKTTCLQNFSSWNDDTLFVDAWTQQIFSKKQMLATYTAEEIKLISTIFSKIELTDPGAGYFVGDKYNQSIHTERWQRKHAEACMHKFWRPLRLSDAKRPTPAAPAEKKNFQK